jgi:hypothetical protein
MWAMAMHRYTFLIGHGETKKQRKRKKEYEGRDVEKLFTRIFFFLAFEDLHIITNVL